MLGFAVLGIVSCGCCRVGSVDLVADFLELRVFAGLVVIVLIGCFPVLWIGGCCFVFWLLIVLLGWG